MLHKLNLTVLETIYQRWALASLFDVQNSICHMFCWWLIRYRCIGFAVSLAQFLASTGAFVKNALFVKHVHLTPWHWRTLSCKLQLLGSFWCDSWCGGVNGGEEDYNVCISYLRLIIPSPRTLDEPSALFGFLLEIIIEKGWEGPFGVAVCFFKPKSHSQFVFYVQNSQKHLRCWPHCMMGFIVLTGQSMFVSLSPLLCFYRSDFGAPAHSAEQSW